MRERKTIREGRVVSDKMDKTIVVEVTDLVPHPRFGKIQKRRSTLKAHDEKNFCRTGDKVSVIEYKPISKTKRWRLLKVIERAVSAED